MSHIKRFGPILLAVLLVALLGVNALAAAAMSDHGSGAAQLGDTLFIVLPDGDNQTLYSIPAAGGDLTQLESRASLGDMVVANGFAYALRSDGGVTQLVKMDATGARTVVTQFESGEQVAHLSYYDEVLYCLLDGGLILIDPETGDYNALGDERMTEYAIVSDVIFYISASDVATYDQTMSDGTELSTASGKLCSMSILGTNPEVIVEKGVADLKAFDDNLFFHNLDDRYVMESGETKDRWLEGKLYRYNIQTGQMTSMNLDYDWAFFPTAQGVLVYTSQNISLFPLTGGDGEMLMAPEAITSLTVMGDDAYVYEHTSQLLTRLPLDGADKFELNPNGQVIISPNADDSPLDESGLDADDGETGDDQTGDDESGDEDEDGGKSESASNSSSSSATSSSYIFPNSSKKKLTRAQILKVDKNKWGYARNEIYARNGYVFKKSKYKDYFENKTWYKPGGFSTKNLSSIEWYNMELIKSLEQEYGLLSGGSKDDGGSSGGSSGTSGGYLLPKSSSKKYTESSLKKALGGDTSLLGYARNEILARHGYVFKTAKYKNYFKKKSWYKPGGYSSGDLNNTEWHNIELIKKMEKKYN